MFFLRPRRGRYRSFAELTAHEREGIDFARRAEFRGSRIAVVAPHGGGIEAGTSEIARALAGAELSFYDFDGMKPRGNEILHVSSGRFDDPSCIELNRTCATVLTVHGAAGKAPLVHVGGLDEPFKSALIGALRGSGIRADRDETEHPGTDPANICNRGTSGAGVQLEISHGMREGMFDGLLRHERAYTTPVFRNFITTIRSVILARNAGPAVT